MLIKRLTFILLFILSILTVHAVVFENGTKYQVVATNYTVTYLLNLNLNLTSIQVYDSGIIFNSTHNISFIPNNQSLNITILNWTDVNNSFQMRGANQTVQWTIKVSNNNQTMTYNRTNQTNSIFTAYDTNYDWNYSSTITVDVTPPSILNITDGSAPQNFTANIELSEAGNATLYWSRNIDLSSNTASSSTTYQIIHNFSVLNLQVTTIYYYQVNGTDMLGNAYNSAIRSITTQAGGSHGNDGSSGGGTYFSSGETVINETIVPAIITLQNKTQIDLITALNTFLLNKSQEQPLDVSSIQASRTEKTFLFIAVFLGIILIFSIFVFNKSNK